MEYLFGKKMTLDGIFEQKNIRQELSKDPKDRTHYLSLVCKIPENSQGKIHTFSEKCVSEWDKDTYFVQKEKTQHLTIVDFGPYSEVGDHIEQLKTNIDETLKEYNSQDIFFWLTEPIIAQSGINYGIKASNVLNDISNKLQVLTEFDKRELKTRSVSLMRYLIPNESFKSTIRDQLIGIENLIMDYKEKIPVKEFLLVRLDKVADHFEIIQTFPV